MGACRRPLSPPHLITLTNPSPSPPVPPSPRPAQDGCAVSGSGSACLASGATTKLTCNTPAPGYTLNNGVATEISCDTYTFGTGEVADDR